MPQFDDIREKLERQLAELRERHAKITQHLRRADDQMPADSEEQAIYLENDEVLEALDERGRSEFVAIRAALGRISAGTYAVCESCGALIPEGRLLVMPTTTQCVSCAARPV